MEIKKDFFKNKKQQTITLDSIFNGKTSKNFINKNYKGYTCCVSFETLYKKRHYVVTFETIDGIETALTTTSEKKVLSYLETNGFILDESSVKETEHIKDVVIQETNNTKEENILVNLSIVNDILKYCEDMQVYDKLGKYNDFYYKLNKIKNQNH